LSAGDIRHRGELAEMRRERSVAVRQRLGERAERQPAFQPFEIGQFRNKRAIDENQPPRLDIAQNCTGEFGTCLGRGIGRRGKRLGVAHQRAQIGIFPLLDAAVRQAFFGEHAEGSFTLGGNRLVAGKPRARLREFMRQRGLRRGLDDGDFGVHAKTSSWYSA
jgi:hypothetical protein